MVHDIVANCNEVAEANMRYLKEAITPVECIEYISRIITTREYLKKAYKKGEIKKTDLFDASPYITNKSWQIRQLRKYIKRYFEDNKEN